VISKNMPGFLRSVQRAVVAAEPSVQRTVVAAMKQEAKQFHAAPAAAINSAQKKKIPLPVVHRQGLDLVTDAYAMGVYGCV
jgi:hypothetical protein